MAVESNAQPAYINLNQARRRLGPGRAGRPVHVGTLVRWITIGVGSGIKLRAVRLPGGWRTTTEWLNEFVEATTAARLGRFVEPATRNPAERRRSHEAADRELAEAGF